MLRDLGEARTLDPLIKSQLLYQLSYQVVLWLQRNDFSASFATTICILFKNTSLRVVA